MSAAERHTPKLRCWECGATFTRNDDLTKHKLTHKNERPFSCSHCGQNFRFKRSFARHLEVIHNIQYEYRKICDICQRSFRCFPSLKSHRKKEHNISEDEEIKTSGLTQKTNYGVTVGSNLKTTQTKTNDVIARAAGEISNFKIPKLKTNEDTPSWTDTSLGGTKSRNANEHRDFTKNPSLAVKEVANGDRTGTTDQKTKSSIQAEKKFPCSKCGRMFDNLRNLARHVRMNNYNGNQAWYQCPHCCNRFTLVNNLRLHFKRFHPGESFNTTTYTGFGNMVFDCGICKKRFQSFDRFIKHKRTHNSFRCRVCHETFETKAEQVRHSKNAHDRDRPYSCPYCESTFARRNCLKSHLQLKHDESPLHSMQNAYACTQCRSLFLKEHFLREHMMTVHGENTGNLNEKQMVVTPSSVGEAKASRSNSDTKRRRFNCGVCGVMFDEHGLLLMHLNNSHSNTHEETATSGGKKAKKIYRRLKHRELNAAILQKYGILSSIIGSPQSDPKSGGERYNCKVCPCNFTSKKSLIRHIKNNAYDHGYYLRKRSIEENGPEEETTGVPEEKKGKFCNLEIRKRQSPPRKQRPRCACDVCGKLFPQRSKMFVHRQKHTKAEFKHARVQRDFYVKPNGMIIAMSKSVIQREIAEHEVSSTSQDSVNACESDNAVVSVYVDRADIDDFGEMDEPMFFARPYVPEITESGNNEQIGITDDMALSTDRMHKSVRASHSEDKIFVDEESADENMSNTHASQSMSNAYPLQKIHVPQNAVYEQQNVSKIQPSQDTTNEQVLQNVANVHASRNMVNVQALQNMPNTRTSENMSNVQNMANVQVLQDVVNEHATQNMINVQPLKNTANVQELHKMANVQASVKMSNTRASTKENLQLPDQMDVTEHISMKSITDVCTRDSVTTCSEPGIDISEQKSSPEEINSAILLRTSQCCTNAKTKGRSSFQRIPLLTNSVCFSCRFHFLEGQNRMTCRLCDHVFCRFCSGVSIDDYNVLFKNESECSSGIWWTCHICKHLVPMFILLLKQLGDFEEIINNRLSVLDQRLLELTSKVKK